MGLRTAISRTDSDNGVGSLLSYSKYYNIVNPDGSYNRFYNSIAPDHLEILEDPAYEGVFPSLEYNPIENMGKSTSKSEEQRMNAYIEGAFDLYKGLSLNLKAQYIRNLTKTRHQFHNFSESKQTLLAYAIP